MLKLPSNERSKSYTLMGFWRSTSSPLSLSHLAFTYWMLIITIIGMHTHLLGWTECNQCFSHLFECAFVGALKRCQFYRIEKHVDVVTWNCATANGRSIFSKSNRQIREKTAQIHEFWLCYNWSVRLDNLFYHRSKWSFLFYFLFCLFWRR